MKHMVTLAAILTLAVLALASLATAGVPQMINYQGRLTDSTGQPLDTTVSITFTIYDDSTLGTSKWTETQSSVTVTNGLFKVILGGVNPIADTVFNDTGRYLGIRVGTDPELSPRSHLISVPYAYRATIADSAANVDDGDWTKADTNIYRLNGNVGIGTTSPQSKLHVYGTHVYIQDDNYPLLFQELGQSGAGSLWRMTLDSKRIRFDASDNGGDFTSYTYPMTLVKEGNVGIGTMNPVKRLHVAGDQQVDGSVTATTYYGDGSNLTGIVPSPDDDWMFINEDDIYHLTGNVGIGTASPEGQVHIVGGGDIITGGAGEEWLFHPRSLAGGDYLQITDRDVGGPWKFGQGIVVHSNGNIGIGTTSPGYKLDVQGGGLRVLNNGNYLLYNGMADILFSFPPRGSGGRVLVHDDGNTLTLNYGGDFTGGTKIGPSVVFANSGNSYINSGNVGIGTTSPGYRLDVNGDAFVRGTTGGGIRAYRADIVNASWGAGGPSVLTVTNNNAYNTNPVVKFEQQNSSAVTSLLEAINSGSGNGIYAESRSTQSNKAAISGRAKADGGSGIYGETWSLGVGGGSSVAVYGWAPASGVAVGGAALGVLGKVNSYQNPDPPYSSVPAGVFGWATATSGVNAGVWGETDSPDGFGVYSAGDLAVDGDFNCNGTKNAVVSTSAGGRALYCQESPEVWFEDFGERQLQDGQAHINLDPLFLETVTISDEHPVKVFVTLNDDCNGVYVKRGLKGFDVIELKNGKSDAHFTYRVVAKRKGFEDKRLEPVENFQASLE